MLLTPPRRDHPIEFRHLAPDKKARADRDRSDKQRGKKQAHGIHCAQAKREARDQARGNKNAGSTKSSLKAPPASTAFTYFSVGFEDDAP